MFLNQIRQRLSAVREQAKRQGANVLQGAAAVIQQDTKPTDHIINLDEAALAKEIEDMQETMGVLDGQLSLKNATTMIEE